MVYRPHIDGLRALAVLGVVIHHAFPLLLPGGFIGVDIFFVISGYLISHILMQEGRASHLDLARFYLRRIRRLLPALILVLLACMVYGWWALLADEYQQLAKHAVGAGLFIVNLMLLGEAGYFDVSSQLKPLLHLWSLSVEEQFYFVWPFVLLWCLGSRRSLSMHIWSILLGSFVLCLYFSLTESAYAFYLPFTRFWELAAGDLLALWHLEHCERFEPTTNPILFIVGLLLVLVPMFFINKHFVWPGLWATLPVLGALCLIHAGTVNATSRQWLAHSWMVWFGLISYPLYLWHWPILTFARIERGVDFPHFWHWV
jgi:peptidoglycan/LPS O-acetylase OafA/YrhL